MHRQLGNTDIYCADTEFGGCDWSNRCTATHVAANRNGLHGYISFTAKCSKDSRCLAVSRIALIGVDLDDRATVKVRSMLGIVFVSVIGVDCMSVVD